MAAPKKNMPAPKNNSTSKPKSYPLPLTKKSAQMQKDMTAIQSADFQKGLKLGLKQGKKLNVNFNPEPRRSGAIIDDRLRGVSTGVITAKQDMAKYKGQQKKSK